MPAAVQRSTQAEVEAFRGLWTLDPEVHFLNHGSFGACPAEVLDEQRAWRDRMERESPSSRVSCSPTWTPRASASRSSSAATRAVSSSCPNATTGVNAVLRSLELGRDDEVLITTLGYNACNNAARFVCERSGARLVEVAIPFPLRARRGGRAGPRGGERAHCDRGPRSHHERHGPRPPDRAPRGRAPGSRHRRARGRGPRARSRGPRPRRAGRGLLHGELPQWLCTPRARRCSTSARIGATASCPRSSATARTPRGGDDASAGPVRLARDPGLQSLALHPLRARSLRAPGP